jgi:hypothetical protein
MGQEIQRLTALAVTRASKPGLYADGAGLYLRVSRNGSKSWALRFTLRGKPREMGLGGLTKVLSRMPERKRPTPVFSSVMDAILSISAEKKTPSVSEKKN